MDSNNLPPHNLKLPDTISFSPFFRYHPTPVGHVGHSNNVPVQIVGPSCQWVNGFYRHPTGMHEAIWRQMEKEKIREEIIAEEIARRRILEAEVRRELMLERESGMQITSHGSMYASCLKSINVDPKFCPALVLPQRMDAIPLGEASGVSTLARHDLGSLETSSQNTGIPRTTESMPLSDTVKEKQKVILMAKPEAKSLGLKRKAEVLPSVSVSDRTLAGDGSKKKVKEEFSCALCQVSSTSDRALKEHVQGKRHKAKESGLRKNGKNFNIGLFPKKIPMPNKLSEIPSSPCLQKGVNISEPEKAMTRIPSEANSETAKTKNLDKKVKQNKGPKCKTSSRRTRDLSYKFWCELCQVGAFAETVMETHRKGKKHLARLQEQNTVGKASTQITLAKQEIEMNPAEVAGEVVEGNAARDSAPSIDEVKLDRYQKDAGEDEDNIQFKGLAVVADGVESKGNHNEVEFEFEFDQKEESITDADNSD